MVVLYLNDINRYNEKVLPTISINIKYIFTYIQGDSLSLKQSLSQKVSMFLNIFFFIVSSC